MDSKLVVTKFTGAVLREVDKAAELIARAVNRFSNPDSERAGGRAIAGVGVPRLRRAMVRRH